MTEIDLNSVVDYIKTRIEELKKREAQQTGYALIAYHDCDKEVIDYHLRETLIAKESRREFERLLFRIEPPKEEGEE